MHAHRTGARLRRYPQGEGVRWAFFSCGRDEAASFFHLPLLDEEEQPCEERKEVNPMEPLYTLLLCLPAALVLIACACGMAILWPPTTQLAAHKTVSRECGRRRLV